MSVKNVVRKINLKVNGKEIVLDDINDELPIDEIKDIYSNQYPQLLNSTTVDKGVNEHGEHHYEFVTVAGTKG